MLQEFSIDTEVRQSSAMGEGWNDITVSVRLGGRYDYESTVTQRATVPNNLVEGAVSALISASLVITSSYIPPEPESEEETADESEALKPPPQQDERYDPLAEGPYNRSSRW